MTEIIKKSMAVLFLILIKLTENKRVEMTEKVNDGVKIAHFRSQS